MKGWAYPQMNRVLQRRVGNGYRQGWVMVSDYIFWREHIGDTPTVGDSHSMLSCLLTSCLSTGLKELELTMPTIIIIMGIIIPIYYSISAYPYNYIQISITCLLNQIQIIYILYNSTATLCVQVFILNQSITQQIIQQLKIKNLILIIKINREVIASMQPGGTSSKIAPEWSKWASFVQENEKVVQKSIWIIGTQNSGKSTFCELAKAFVANDPSKGLQFDNGKVKMYNLPSVISNNLLKVQTQKPMHYGIKSQIQGIPNAQLIDVPTFIFPPFNQANKKLWSPIDAKISFNFLMHQAQQVSFVLLIDQKYTRAPMDGTKSILSNFIDMFKQPNQKLYKSTAIIISKCPSGFNISTCKTRIQKCIQKMQDLNRKKIEQWFNCIKQHNIFAFNKFSEDEEKTKKQIVLLYENIVKLTPYTVEKKEVKGFGDMGEELSTQLKKFLSGIENGIGGLINIAIEIVDDLIATPEAFLAAKDKLAKQEVSFPEKKTNDNLSIMKSEQSSQLPSYFNILAICQAVIKNKQKIKKSIFKYLLEQFVKFKIITEDEQIYKGLKERADFVEFFYEENGIAGWNIAQAYKKIEEWANKVKRYSKLNQHIVNFFKKGQDVQFYQTLIEIIDFFTEGKNLQGSQLSTIWLNSSLQIAANLTQPTNLKSFLQIQKKVQQWNKTELLADLLTKIAQVLMNAKKVSFAVSLFNKCGNPFQGIRAMQNFMQNQKKSLYQKKYSIQQFKPYLQLLQDIGLYEKSYQFCYQLGNIYQSQKQRSILKQFLTKPPSQPKPQTIASFIDKKISGLEQKDIIQLNSVAEQLQNKYKAAK